MTNPLEEIRELAEGWKKATVISEPVTPFQLLRACSAQLLAILDASQGYVCVPVEPTEAMLAAAQATNGKKQLPRFSVLRTRWSAMLAASKETNRG